VCVKSILRTILYKAPFFLHPNTVVNLDQTDDDSILSVPGQEQIEEDEDDDFVPSVDSESDEENSFSSHELPEKEEDDLDWSINMVSHDDDDPFEIGSLDSDYSTESLDLWQAPIGEFEDINAGSFYDEKDQHNINSQEGSSLAIPITNPPGQRPFSFDLQSMLEKGQMITSHVLLLTPVLSYFCEEVKLYARPEEQWLFCKHWLLLLGVQVYL
jgi:hypothetical protein